MCESSIFLPSVYRRSVTISIKNGELKGQATLTRYSNFASAYFLMVSLVSGIAYSQKNQIIIMMMMMMMIII